MRLLGLPVALSRSFFSTHFSKATYLNCAAYLPPSFSRHSLEKDINCYNLQGCLINCISLVAEIASDPVLECNLANHFGRLHGRDMLVNVSTKVYLCFNDYHVWLQIETFLP
jgi:hypothetical protein